MKGRSLNWEQITAKALRQPTVFLAAYEEYRAACADPPEQRQLSLLRSKALLAIQNYDEAEKEVLELLEEAIQANDMTSIAHSNVVLSKCYFYRGHQERERPCLEMALDAAKQTRNNDLIAEILCYISATYMREHDRQQTLAYLQKAENQLTEVSSPAIRLKIMIDTGSAYYSFFQYDKAMVYISSALEISTKLEDRENQLMLMNNLAALYAMMGKDKEAEDVLTRGLKISRDCGQLYHSSQYLFNLGMLYQRLDRIEDALAYYRECEEVGRSIGLNDPFYLSGLHSNMAGCYRHLGKADETWEQLELAGKAIAMIGDKTKQMELDVNKANFLSWIGNYRESRKLLREVIAHTKKNKLYDLLIQGQLNLINTYEMEKKYQEALKKFYELHQIHLDYQQYLMTEQIKHHEKRIEELVHENQEVRQKITIHSTDSRKIAEREFIGQSDKHKKVLEDALMAAQHPNTSVLILGESGTGKDVLARIIHSHSARKDAPMVPINMAAISPNLLESIFFGHKKGSFTGAITDSKGLFLEANNGTLFLDEISEMPINLQAKLLRVLETKALTPVGSGKEISFDTRVISSTNRDIIAMIRNDQFRLDLYHRLNTIEIYIPPLRERQEDIGALVRHFAELLGRELKTGVPRIDESFIRCIRDYSFPGNVRELKNIVERLLIMRGGKTWDEGTLDALPSVKYGISPIKRTDVREKTKNLERQEIIDALMQCGGKQKDAANILGISESTLTRRIAAYKLSIYTRKGK